MKDDYFKPEISKNSDILRSQKFVTIILKNRVFNREQKVVESANQVRDYQVANI